MSYQQIYAGIGPRNASPQSLKRCTRFATLLAKNGFILRSGGADGCDTAFEAGCDLGGGVKEIFLPWKGFNGNTSELYTPSEEAYEIAAKYHPRWGSLKEIVRKLMARNSHQILGPDLKTPVNFVATDTPGGEIVGGTGQALRIALDYGIPIINFGKL